MSDRAPVFLVGAARSGTSLLYKMLCLHPEVAYISNWVRRYPRVPQLAVLNRLGRRLSATRQTVWFGRDSNAYVYGSARALWRRLFPMPVEGEPVYGHHGIPQLESQAAGSPEQQRALAGTFAAVRRWGGGRRVVNKRIANNRRIPLLAEIFPGARFVEIVRDGRAVAHSLSRVDWWDDDVVWWYGGTPRQWREEGRDPWEICARNWVEELRELEAGLARVAPERVLRVRYETLVREPHATLERIAEFMDLAPDAGWRAQLATLRFPDQNERWRDQLDAATVARIEDIQREHLRRHGYLA
ncbi:MAG: sulfotransferase [Gemmatimonadetes bacterium]|nr:sulfotransferase [Gemmatimonadota bacterium]